MWGTYRTLIAIEVFCKTGKEFLLMNVSIWSFEKGKYARAFLKAIIVVINKYNLLQNIWQKVKKIKQKLVKTSKFWYLVLCKFGQLFPRINFWKGEWAVLCVSIYFWDFLIFSNFRISCLATYLQSFLYLLSTSVLLWQIKPVLKHYIFSKY